MELDVEIGGHRIEVRIGRLPFWERVLHDGHEVSRERFFGGGTHAFWVMEDGQEVRYEVDTGRDAGERITAIRRLGVVVYRHGEAVAAAQRR